MEINDPDIRYKVCFSCKVFMTIHLTSPMNITDLGIFEKVHSGHMVQTVNFNEIDEEYICTIPYNLKEKTLHQIQEMLINKNIGKMKNEIST